MIRTFVCVLFVCRVILFIHVTLFYIMTVYNKIWFFLVKLLNYSVCFVDKQFSYITNLTASIYELVPFFHNLNIE